MLLHKVTGIKPDRQRGKECKEIFVQNRYVGIEFEVEKYSVPVSSERQAELLDFKSDGSLRGNSREVVTVPVNGENIVLAIREYLSLLNPEAETTSRCGLHVHVDMRECTVQQLINVLCTYCIVEDIMFRFCGENRYGNPYCLPLNDTLVSNKSTFINLLSSDSNYVSAGIHDTTKYSALNILPLQRLGTVEFRAHEGTLDQEKIIEWVNLVLLVVDHGVTFKGTPQNMVDMICASPERLLQNIFKEYFETKVKVTLKDMDDMLRNGRNFQQYLVRAATLSQEREPEEEFFEEEPDELEEVDENYPEEVEEEDAPTSRNFSTALERWAPVAINRSGNF